MIKISASGLVIGIGIFILTIFLGQALPVYLTDLTTAQLETLKVFLLFVGMSSIFIGTIQRG